MSPYRTRENRKMNANESYKAVFKYPRRFKSPRFVIFVSFYPKRKAKPLFFFEKSPKKTPLRHLEGAILPYNQDEKFVGKQIAIYTDHQNYPSLGILIVKFSRREGVRVNPNLPSLGIVVVKFPRLVFILRNTSYRNIIHE